ncbi:MAG: DnaJ domain-containing protein [Verrucomicrobia bacterium]|nr:DnaJ domain-containing protein [Verrucomicrobiota bacterium]
MSAGRMTDYFTLLQEPRRPWLDVEKLKGKFFQFSAEVHPDRSHNAPEAEKQATNERYQELNAAYNCLRDPKERLRHLLELECGAAPANIQQAPAQLMDLFFEIGQACKAVDVFLAEKARAASPLLKVKFLEDGLNRLDELNAMQQKLRVPVAALEEELKAMNTVWESAGDGASGVALPLRRLEEIYRELSFLSRWTAQIQERVAQLAM